MVGLSLQLSAWRIVVAAATLVAATLGDVLFARCSGSSLRDNLLPTHLVGELAAELGGYRVTQSALAVHCLLQQLVKRERAVGDGYGIEGMSWISSDLFSPCQS